MGRPLTCCGSAFLSPERADPLPPCFPCRRERFPASRLRPALRPENCHSPAASCFGRGLHQTSRTTRRQRPRNILLRRAETSRIVRFPPTTVPVSRCPFPEQKTDRFQFPSYSEYDMPGTRLFPEAACPICRNISSPASRRPRKQTIPRPLPEGESLKPACKKCMPLSHTTQSPYSSQGRGQIQRAADSRAGTCRIDRETFLRNA